ncbi:MAG TPA: hypothetical protein ENI59_00170 [Euryarchaeota archaeon]|nr:hypothetical protein [Euryarchaeota archaeon]
MMRLEIDPKDWEEINNYLKEWDEWRKKRHVGRPDFTSDAIYLVPFTIALIKSQERIEKLTWALVVLTVVLFFLGVIQVFLYLSG